MIIQKPNGKYLVDARDESGKRMERTFNTKAEAKVFEAMLTTDKYNKQLENNGLKAPRYSILEALTAFENSKIDLRPKSIQKYKRAIGEFAKFVKALNINSLDEFTPDKATAFFNELVKERTITRNGIESKVRAKPKTINFYLSTIRAFFQEQYIKGYIQRNPMIHIKNLRVEKRKPEYFTEAELKSFFEQEMHDCYRSAFLALLFSGLRIGELVSLTWNDIDLTRKVLIIQPKEKFKAKTYNSNRIIPMNEILYRVVKDRFENYSSSEYVFTSRNGYQLRERRTLQICKKIALNAGITSNAYLHKFRHTYATMLIHRGVSIQNIKELLGHWSVVETERYAHNKSDHLFPDVQKLDNLLSA